MDRALTQKVDALLGKFDMVLERLQGRDGDADRSLSTEEAAAFLCIHKTTLLRYAQSRVIPFHRIGKTFTFLRSDLIGFRETYRTEVSGTFLGKLITQGK